ncbi:MAG TPA: ribosomal protein L7/L12 [Solirubrobacterales bacterium]|nr:ribosomal protein L7/L12 [Solirubrobacterales bacterium]
MSTPNILDHGRRIAELERKVSELYRRLGQEEPTALGDPDTGVAEPATVVAGEDPRLIELVQAGKELPAIKLYRELTGQGLKEAKDAVDELKRMYEPQG